MRMHHSLLQSTRFALTGIKLALDFNRNLRVHLLVMVLVIVSALLFRLTSYEAGIVAVLIVLVICTEMMNTVTEEIVDLVTKEHREEARIAKDVAAGMVLIAAMGAAIIGLLIFLPHLPDVVRRFAFAISPGV